MFCLKLEFAHGCILEDQGADSWDGSKHSRAKSGPVPWSPQDAMDAELRHLGTTVPSPVRLGGCLISAYNLESVGKH